MAGKAKAKGTLALASRDFDAAVNHFSEAIKLAPTSHDLYSNRYVAHASLHHYDEALSDAKKAVELKSDCVEGYCHLGAAHLRLGLKQLEEAVDAYKKGLGIDPSNEALKSGLAEASQALGVFEMAQQNARKEKVMRDTTGKCAHEPTSIENLSDPLLCKILSYLPVKCSVRTSPLRKRWRELWLQVSDFDFNSVPGRIPFVEVTNRFLDHGKQPIEKFKLKLTFQGNVVAEARVLFQSWICKVTRRKVSHLHIDYHMDEYEALVYTMHSSMYTCETLVDLRLSFVALCESEYVSLPCLKTMYLTNVMFDADATLEKLVSSCLVLEELHVNRNGEYADFLKRVVVKSSSLKRLSLVFHYYSNVSGGPGGYTHTVEMDCPTLEYLRLDDMVSESFIIRTIGPSPVVDVNMGFLDTVVSDLLLSVKPLNATMLAEFFTAISTASSMKLSRVTVQVMRKYFPKFEPLPQFSMLSSVEASFFQSSWMLLPAFFGGCPNLQSLMLDLDDYLGSEKQLIKLLDVRQGFFSTLKFVKLTMPLADRRATPTKLALAAYFLRNCDVLEKLSVSAGFSYYILDHIKKIPKKSLRCEIVVVD